MRFAKNAAWYRVHFALVTTGKIQGCDLYVKAYGIQHARQMGIYAKQEYKTQMNARFTTRAEVSRV